MPDPSNLPEAVDGEVGLGLFLGSSRLDVGPHEHGVAISTVDFNLTEVIDPATGAPYATYVTGGIDITGIVANTRRCRYKQIWAVIPQFQHFGGTPPTVTEIPAIRFARATGPPLIYRPGVGDILLQLFRGTDNAGEAFPELANGQALRDATIRCTVIGIRGKRDAGDFLDIQA